MKLKLDKGMTTKCSHNKPRDVVLSYENLSHALKNIQRKSGKQKMCRKRRRNDDSPEESPYVGDTCQEPGIWLFFLLHSPAGIKKKTM